MVCTEPNSAIPVTHPENHFWPLIIVDNILEPPAPELGAVSFSTLVPGEAVRQFWNVSSNLYNNFEVVINGQLQAMVKQTGEGKVLVVREKLPGRGAHFKFRPYRQKFGCFRPCSTETGMFPGICFDFRTK